MQSGDGRLGGGIKLAVQRFAGAGNVERTTARVSRHDGGLESELFPMNPIIVDPDILGGTPVFRGTRVPVQTLFDHLEAGDALDVFLDDFPTVSREMAVEVIEASRNSLFATAGR